MSASTYAVVEGGAVVNVILWDGESDVGLTTDALIAIPRGELVGVGFGYADGLFSAPSAVFAPVPPDTIETGVPVTDSEGTVSGPVIVPPASGRTDAKAFVSCAAVKSCPGTKVCACAETKTSESTSATPSISATRNRKM
jgi:hypothetical protein